MPPIPIQNPSGYAVIGVAAFADSNGEAVAVGAGNPLPVSLAQSPNAAVSGSTSTSGLIGPFDPVPGRNVVLTLSGSWIGTIRLLRTTDAGVTKLPLTIGGQPWAVFTTNCCEAAWEESEGGAELWLDITLASGNVAYRLAQ